MAYSPAISLIPRPLHGKNLRTELTQREWDNIRRPIIAERGSRCEVSTCGREEADTSRIKAHEEWEYDTSRTPAVARLTGIRLCCWHCHAIEHFGFTGRMVMTGQFPPQVFDDTVAHFCRLNHVGPKEFMAHALDAFAKCDELSALQWQIDWGDYTPMVESRQAKRAAKIERGG